MHESGVGRPDPNLVPSNGLGCSTKRAESYTDEMLAGDISALGQESCPRQQLQLGIFGDEKERNVT